MQEGLYAIVGSAGRGALEAGYHLEDAAPFAVVAPSSESEVCALLEYTYSMRTPCLVAGGGTHLTHLEPPESAWWLLSTRRLNRVIDYAPQDLVLTVGAGMTLQAVQDLLREHQQYLPWNPALPQQATIGGIVASNRAGSWRYRHGTPRDRLLAIRAVIPEGIAFKSGAKVVKSVAGYDLHRLLCGAWGTLAVLTEITLKVQPMPNYFEAVGWRTTWDALEPTLAELMQMPLQPDGMTVLTTRENEAQSGLSLASTSLETPPADLPQNGFPRAESTRVDAIARLQLPTPRTEEKAHLGHISAAATLLEPPPAVAPVSLLEPQTEPRTTTDSGTPAPYLLLEFSGLPEGVAWQIQQLRERGYPAEPVSEAMLHQVRDWLAPRRHALLLQILMRPSEIADALMRWSELPGISAQAHAGSGVLYIAADESGLTDALLQRVRALTAKYRVLRGTAWLRAHSGGELPKLSLTDGERRLMQQIKATLDDRGILPSLIRGAG